MDEDNYNLRSIWEGCDMTMYNDEDSPFSQYQIDCDYHAPENFKSVSDKLPNSMSYFHINCRSLSANWDSFRELVGELHGEHFYFDCIGISETFNCERDQRIILAWLS